MPLALTTLLRRFKGRLALTLALLMLLTSVPTAPLFAQETAEAASATATAQHVATTVYVVQRGDTLGTIARRYQTTIATLLRLNPQIRNPNRIFVGQRLRVPVLPPTDPGGFTITRIHLISLDDGGPLGCGDTLVPVVQEIPATRAVLRATLERLLSIRTQYYGESGLYNALYQSSLQLEDVRIDHRVATIWLSGQVVMGGVCDAPRIQAQLEQAALQFSTVDQVQIYVNGNRLQNVLQ